jgi:hypothetical protein
LKTKPGNSPACWFASFWQIFRSGTQCTSAYNGETGEGLAPTAEQSKDHVFPGFVGWNLLVQDILQCETNRDCLLLDWPGKT